MLGFGEMRDAVRNGLGYPWNHVAHADVGDKVAEQECVLIAHRMRQRAFAREHVLRMSYVYVPARHTVSPCRSNGPLKPKLEGA